MNKLAAFYPSPVGNILIECTDDLISALLFEKKSSEQIRNYVVIKEPPSEHAL